MLTGIVRWAVGAAGGHCQPLPTLGHTCNASFLLACPPPMLSLLLAICFTSTCQPAVFHARRRPPSPCHLSHHCLLRANDAACNVLCVIVYTCSPLSSINAIPILVATVASSPCERGCEVSITIQMYFAHSTTHHTQMTQNNHGVDPAAPAAGSVLVASPPSSFSDSVSFIATSLSPLGCFSSVRSSPLPFSNFLFLLVLSSSPSSCLRPHARHPRRRSPSSPARPPPLFSSVAALKGLQRLAVAAGTGGGGCGWLPRWSVRPCSVSLPSLLPPPLLLCSAPSPCPSPARSA